MGGNRRVPVGTDRETPVPLALRVFMVVVFLCVVAFAVATVLVG